ncbi:hypothetical protein PYCC9005_000519 [Savitreella phatthalungensis]
MAQFLASIYGTEQDKVNCSFYFKIGACRHGDRCSRKHVKPAYSQTVLLPNLYVNPANDPAGNPSGHSNGHDRDHHRPRPPPQSSTRPRVSESEVQAHFDAFYEDIYAELCAFGEVEALLVCDNTGDHLIGNVYARFKYEEDAAKAVDKLSSRWYDGRPVFAELSPVTDFREACCRQHETSECLRGGFCNFMHRRKVSPALARELDMAQRKHLKLTGKDKSPSRSPSPVRR